MIVVVCLIGGILLGNYLDKRFGTSPWLLLLFTLLGLAAAFKAIYDQGKKL